MIGVSEPEQVQARRDSWRGGWGRSVTRQIVTSAALETATFSPQPGGDR
jgi:hypothetical protein